MSVPTISRDELRAVVDAVTLVEALPQLHYDSGHLPGALRIDHEHVAEQAPELLPDKGAPIVVYCANEPCANSGIAASKLAALGYSDVRKYAGGKEDWRAAGLELEVSATVG